MQLPKISQQESWPAPNIINPASRGTGNFVITCTVLPLSLIVVGLRIFTRIKLYRRWAVDDSLVIASLIPTLAYFILGLTWDFNIGWLHIWDYPTADITKGLRMILLSQILFVVASALIKISILMFIYRLLMNSQVLFKSLIHTMTIAILTQAVCFLFLHLFQCHSISDYWIISNEPQQCLRESYHVVASGTVDVVATLIIFIFLLHLENSITVMVIFITLILAALTEIVRIYYLVNAIESWDRLWDFYPAWVAGSVQLFLAIICASIPPLEQLLTCTPLLPKASLSPSLRESKDDFQFLTKPTIYRELFREQHPELHRTLTPSISPDMQTPTPPSQTLPNQNDQLLLYYLQSFSEDSQFLSPILEESYVSQLSDASAEVKRCIPSYRSSISSFNVAARPASCYTRTKSTNLYNFSHVICVPHLREQSFNQTELSRVNKDTDSDTFSVLDSKDISIQDSCRSMNGPTHSEFGTKEMSLYSSNSNLLKLSEFEFERRTDWNRDRESKLSRISEWGAFAGSHRSDTSNCESR